MGQSMRDPENFECIRSELRKLTEEIMSINARPFAGDAELLSAELIQGMVPALETQSELTPRAALR